MRDIDWDVQRIKNLVESLEQRLNRDSTVGLTAEILDTLDLLDQDYMEYCSNLDLERGDEPGTAYNDEYGPNIEYYIEADDWHKISRALRKLKNTPT